MMVWHDAFTGSFRASLRAMVASIVANELENTPSAHALDGIVVPGSYNKAAGEVNVAWLQTLGEPQPVIFYGVQLLTPAYGFQSGPRGGERCVLVVGESGVRAILEHGTDDSPLAPAGEHHLAHRSNVPRSSNSTPPPIDAYLHLTNDGKTAGDNKAGLRALVGAFMQWMTTAGFTFSMDDVGKVALLVSPGGLRFAADDNLNEFTMSRNGGTMSGLVTKDDLQTALNAQRTATQTAITALAAECQSGSGVTAPTIATTTATGSSVAETDD